MRHILGFLWKGSNAFFDFSKVNFTEDVYAISLVINCSQILIPAELCNMNLRRIPNKSL